MHKIQAYGIPGTSRGVAIEVFKAQWKTVTSGVPQLFILFIPDCMVQHIKLYADDSKIIGIIKSEADCQSLQADVDSAVEWTHKWLMFFNIDKCKVMHVGLAKKSNHVCHVEYLKKNLYLFILN
jgi:hypothetical protein